MTGSGRICDTSWRAWQRCCLLLPYNQVKDLIHVELMPSAGWKLVSDSAPTFVNADFSNAFSQSFTAVARSLSPNAKFDPTNITPHWPTWSHGDTEMLFNKTDGNDPVVRTFSTSSDLLERCRWDLYKNIQNLNEALKHCFFRILNSLGAFSAQWALSSLISWTEYECGTHWYGTPR